MGSSSVNEPEKKKFILYIKEALYTEWSIINMHNFAEIETKIRAKKRA